MGQALMMNTQREKVPLNLNIPIVCIKLSTRFIRRPSMQLVFLREKALKEYFNFFFFFIGLKITLFQWPFCYIVV